MARASVLCPARLEGRSLRVAHVRLFPSLQTSATFSLITAVSLLFLSRLAGSRPGALIAGAWAVLMHHGEAGYIASTTRIMTTMCAIRDGILASPTLSQDLYILGDPKVSVVAFASKSKDVDILQVGDAMSKRGWHLNALEGPSALHMACTVSRASFYSMCSNSER